MRKIVSVLLVAAMLISVLAGCGADSAKSTSNDTVNDAADSAAANDTGAQNEDNGSKTESGKLTEVTWVSASALASLDYCWIYVAQEMGYFEQEGLKVNIIEDTTSSGAKFVAAGSAEFSCTSPGVAVSTYDAGATNITAVCNQVILNHFGLAVNKDSGVKDWSDLEGCTIASVNDVWPALFNPILAAAGVDTNSVTYVSYGSAEYEALNTGVAQVMGSWLSEYYMCLGMGYDWDWLDGNSVLPQISHFSAFNLSIRLVLLKYLISH